MRTRLLVTLLLLLCFAIPAQAITLYTEITPPGSYLHNGKPSGFNVEIVQELAKRQNMSADIHFLPWARALDRTLHESGTGLFACTRTPEREELFQWVGPIARVTWTFFSKKDADITINSLEEAKQYTIGTYTGDARESFLLKHGFTNLERVTSNKQNLKKVLNDRADLLFSTNVLLVLTPESSQLIAALRNHLKPVYTVAEKDLYLVFNKQTPKDMVDGFSRALKSMHDDGTFARIYNKWLPDSEPPVTPLPIQANQEQ